MKIIRKLLFLGILSFIVLFSLTANICVREFNSEALIADISEIDRYLEESSAEHYHISPNKQLGIILYKEWEDTKDGSVPVATVQIRTREKQTVELNFDREKNKHYNEIDDFHVGDLVAFTNPPPQDRPFVRGFQLIRRNDQTGFKQILTDNRPLGQ